MAQLIEDIEYLDDDIVEIQLQGYIDGNNVEEIKNKITKLVNEDKSKIIIKMKNVEFISSNAWKTINDLNKEIRNIKGSIKVLNLETEIEGIIHLLEYDKSLDYFRDREKAIKSFKKSEQVETYQIRDVKRDNIDNLTYIKNLSLQEKIKRIISSYQKISLWQLNDILSHPVYDENVNIIKLYLNMKKIRDEMEK